MRGKALMIFAVALILVASAWAGTGSVLYSFASQTGDGFYPYSGMISDKSGNLYGTTYDGGVDSRYGAVFELSPSNGTWTETVLYSFTGTNGDGYRPVGPVVFDKKGNLYGTAEYGGAYGYGMVFELQQSGGTWTESVLYSFSAKGDGAYPASGLVFDAKGNLYGTTYEGGTSNRGTAFQLAPKGGTWTETVLHSFSGGTDGQYPLFGGLTPPKRTAS